MKRAYQKTINKHEIITLFKENLSRLTFPCFLFTVLLLETRFAQNPTLALLKFFKLAEVSYLTFFIAKEMDKNISLNKTALLLMVGVFYESFLAHAQLVNQGSLGGFWWWLGERTFTSGTPFISQAVINGILALRPYGTLPHPNVLGAYVVVALTLCYFLIKKNTRKDKRWLNILFTICLVAGFITTLFSLSRIAIGLFLISFAVLVVGEKKIKKSLIFLTCLLGIVLVRWLNTVWYRVFSLADVDQKSYLLRANLNESALRLFAQNPLLGVGLNNFILANNRPGTETHDIIVRSLQPTHNIYLLIVSEAGIVGLAVLVILMVCCVKTILKEKNKTWQRIKTVLLLQLLAFGLFDHYLYTLQQGLLLCSFVFGVIFNKNNSKNVDKI